MAVALGATRPLALDHSSGGEGSSIPPAELSQSESTAPSSSLEIAGLAGEGEGIGVNSVVPNLPSGARNYVDISTNFVCKLSTDENARFVAAIGDPRENDDEVADLFGPEEPTAPPVEVMAPQTDEPQVPIRTEKPKRHPGDPTKEEIEAHNLTHANYRSWCAICNRAALKEDPHYKQTKDEVSQGLPCISFDYKTMGESDTEDDKITCLVGRDRWTKATFAHVVKGKGLVDDWIVQQVYDDIQSLGYPAVRIRADTEPSINALLQKIKDLRDHRGSGKTEIERCEIKEKEQNDEDEAGQTTLVEEATPGQPQTNGVAEMAVQEVTTQCRKYKIALETKLGKPIHAKSVVFKWLVRHAADTINRNSVGHDGKVPLQRFTHKVPKQIGVESCQEIFAKTQTCRDKRKRSLAERAVAGIWLGIWGPTGENIVAIGPGHVIKVRTINRRPAAERWSSNVIDFLQATPQQWEMQGAVTPIGAAFDAQDLDTREAQAAIDLLQAAGPAVPHVPRPRRPSLSAQERWEMGGTPGCDACEALLITGGPQRPHSKECWDRVMKILESTDSGRAKIARAQSRMEQYQSIMANSVAPETSVSIAPPAAAHWPNGGEVVQDDSEGDAEEATEPAKTEASIDAVYARYIQCKLDGKVTKEGIRQVFERLDKDITKRAEKRRIKFQSDKTTNDVSEVYSPPRVTEVAEATGLRAGWALDLTVNKPDGTPWDLSVEANKGEARKLLKAQAPHLLILSPMCAAFSALQSLNYIELKAQSQLLIINSNPRGVLSFLGDGAGWGPRSPPKNTPSKI